MENLFFFVDDKISLFEEIYFNQDLNSLFFQQIYKD